MAKLAVLFKNDLKNIKRDYLLILLMLYPFLAAVIARFLVPLLREYFLSPTFDLAAYYHVILVFLVIVTPYIYGIMQAFTILDERDDMVLNAIRVTPFPLLGYFLYKIGFAVVFSIVSILLVIPLSGLVEVSTGYLVIVACVSSLAVPMSAFLLNAFADNKVEGFAVGKAAGFLIIFPAAAFFLPSNIQLIAGVIPGFWPAMAFARLVDPSYAKLPLGIYLLAGTVYSLFLSYILYIKFMRKITI